MIKYKTGLSNFKSAEERAASKLKVEMEEGSDSSNTDKTEEIRSRNSSERSKAACERELTKSQQKAKDSSAAKKKKVTIVEDETATEKPNSTQIQSLNEEINSFFKMSNQMDLLKQHMKLQNTSDNLFSQLDELENLIGK